MCMSEIRIMLVDDHEVVRQGLRSLLERRAHLRVVAEASTVAEAVTEATRVLMLTSYADDEAVYASIVAGAAGYLLKQTRGRELVSAIEAVARGDSLLDPGVTSKVLTRMRELAAGGHKDPLAELTEQERRILGLIAEGKTNREIASTVYLSEKTVKNYVSTILSKLGMERRAQAAAFLAEQRARGH